MSPGVLTKEQIGTLFASEAISCRHFQPPAIGGSAFDLRLGKEAWRLEEGQRPATRELAQLKAKSSKLAPVDDEDGPAFLFEKGGIYLVELDNHLDLPPNITGRATGKSSIGRLDVITRLLTDNSSEYDVVEAGYSGSLHLLILPQTFSIKLPPGDSLNQLRLFSGAPYNSVVTRAIIGSFGTPFWFVPKDDRREHQSWDDVIRSGESLTADPALFDLTVDLADPDFPFIFGATTLDTAPIDLRKGSKTHDPTHYFDQVQVEAKGASRSVVLQKDSFYIMKSRERLYIPPDVAVEVIAISERIGDVRIHYAGFAHPGFGRYEDPVKRGTPLIFEVRATDMPTRLYDGSLLAKIQLFRMSTKGTQEKSEYDRQELKLSSIFKDWPGATDVRR